MSSRTLRARLRSPWRNGCLSVSSSNSTTATEKTSVRAFGDTKGSRNSSGAMYSGLPSCTPAGVAIRDPGGSAKRWECLEWNVSCRRQTPKSMTLTSPSGSTITFEGVRSRWMTPKSCATSRARQICSPIFTTASASIPPTRARRSRRFSPRRFSMTMNS